MCILTSTVFYQKPINSAKVSEAAVIGISEWKLNDSVLFSEIQIANCDLICCDTNRHGDNVTCFIRGNLTQNDFFPPRIYTFFFY